MNQKEAIKELWKNGFFKEYRKTSEIGEKVFDEFEITYSNISVILKKCEFLRKTNKGWVLKYPSKREDEIMVHYFEPGKPRTSRKSFKTILNNLTGEIRVCDPYLTEDSLEALESMKRAKVKFLTSSSRNNIKVTQQDLVDFKTENSNVAIMGFGFNYLHDRYIISKNRLYLLGHGLSIRKKESFIIELSDKIAKDLIQSLSTTFDIRWRRQGNTIFP